MHENEIGTAIVDCAVHLHQDLGPGLLENARDACAPDLLTNIAAIRQRSRIQALGVVLAHTR